MARLDRKAHARRRPSRRPKWYVLVAGALGLLLVATGVWLSLRPTAGSAPGPDSYADGPRLVVDRELIDLGVQPVDRLVTATFQLSNQGSGRLRILGEPAVELIEGC